MSLQITNDFPTKVQSLYPIQACLFCNCPGNTAVDEHKEEHCNQFPFLVLTKTDDEDEKIKPVLFFYFFVFLTVYILFF